MLISTKKLQKGFTIIELLIVIAIIGILATLVLTNFQGAQAKGRDTVRKNDINSIFAKLEEFYNENGGYPDGALDGTLVDGDPVLAGIDDEALIDADEDSIVYTGGFVVTGGTEPTIAPDNDDEYVYAAYDCDSAAAQDPVGATCGKYKLGTFLEREDPALFEKDSLN